METSLTSLAQNLDLGQAIPGRLESLVNGLPVVMYAYRPEVGPTFVTEGIRILWGYEPEEFLSDKSFWKDRVHPEDLAQVFDQLPLLLEHGRRGYDYRFRTKRGEYRWIHDEVRLVRDSSGNPLEIIGYCVDITEQKLTEAALRESEARQKLIFNGTSDLQTLVRVEPGIGFVIETVNQATAEHFKTRPGGDIRDFIGKDFREFLAASGLTAEEIEFRQSIYQRALEENTTVYFESSPSQVRDSVEVSVSPLLDEHGRCTHLLWNGRDITERVKAEAKRRESEARYALVTEAIHEGIFDWNVVSGAYYLSPRYKEILGYGDDELASDPESFFGRIHPEDSARMAETVDRYNQDPAKDRFADELRLKHRDGTYRRVVSRGRIVRNEKGAPIRIVGAIGDMTDRLEAAAKLAASEQRLRDIIESLFGFLGVFTLDGILIDCNHGTLEPAGVRPEDLIGRRFWETEGWRHSPEQQNLLREMMARAAAGEVVRFETRPLIRGQFHLVVDMTFGPLRDRQGNICNIVAHGMDITPRKQAEAELLHAKEAAESANRAKSEFLANMSHEIRTPMNGIIGLTEVLLDTSLDAEQHEFLTLIQGSAASLLTIINDILDVSKIEAGKLSLERREFDLRAVVLDMLRGLKVPAGAKGLSLVCDIDPDVPALLCGDAGRLRQVLVNLIGNAIKFTDRGEVSVAIERWPESADALHFSVRDSGIGIPAEKQSLIFEAFTQVDGSFTRRFGGTGLGLTIASRLIQMMDGRIWVESEEGHGSTFHFTARLEPRPAAANNFIGPAGL